MDELSKVDPTSESFRYPTTTQDESALPDNMIYIDLKHFSEEINTVSQVIEYIDNMMITELERKEEFESEYYGEY